jgi:hypothetical protein
MKPLLLAAALGMLAGGALAQNTKGTGAETRTTTTTNPGASVGLPTPRGWSQPCDRAIRHRPSEYEGDKVGTRAV